MEPKKGIRKLFVFLYICPGPLLAVFFSGIFLVFFLGASFAVCFFCFFFVFLGRWSFDFFFGCFFFVFFCFLCFFVFFCFLFVFLFFPPFFNRNDHIAGTFSGAQKYTRKIHAEKAFPTTRELQNIYDIVHTRPREKSTNLRTPLPEPARASAQFTQAF